MSFAAGILLGCSAAAAFAAWRKDASPETAFLPPLTYLAGILISYAGFAAGLPRYGICGVFVLNGMLWLLAAVGICRDPAGSFRRFFTPPMVIFLLWSGFFFLFNRERLFYHWDEFSHWGAAAKALSETWRLPCEFPGILRFASYPPGMPLLQKLYLQFNGVFSESTVIFATVNLLFSILALGVMGRQWRRDTALIILYALAGWLLPPAFIAFFYSTYADGPLAMMLAAGLLIICFRPGGELPALAAAAVTAGALVLTKASGGALALLLPCFWLISRRETLRQMPRRIAGAVLIAAVPVSLYWSWQHLVRLNRVPEVFASGRITPAALAGAFFRNEPSHAWETIRLWGMKLLTGYPFEELWISYSPGALLTMLFIALCFRQIGRNSGQPEMQRCCRILSAASVILPLSFAVTLLCCYLFTFSPREALTLASFDRYLNTLLLALYFTALVLAGRSCGGERELRHDPMYILIPLLGGYLLPLRRLDHWGWRIAVILLWIVLSFCLLRLYRYSRRQGICGGLKRGVFLLLLLLPMLRMPWIINNTFRIIHGHVYWKRDLLDAAAAKINALPPDPGNAVFIHQGGTGEYYYMMHTLCFPRFRQFPWSIVTPGTPQEEWKNVMTPEKLAAAVTPGGVVYCHGIDANFIRDYGILFAETPQERQLYRKGTDGRFHRF